MGIIWGEVASGALAKVGQEVRLDQQRARERRQNIINIGTENMFNQGKEEFSKRKKKRESLKGYIKFFETMGFNRNDIQKIVSLPEEDLNTMKLSLQEGQKYATEEDPFDAAAFLSMPVDEAARGITGEKPKSYNEWETSVLNNVMGKINPNKFKNSSEENSFMTNFRSSLRNQFGWSGGEREESLQTAALLSGKTPAELEAALTDSYERADITPPQYTIPLTGKEKLDFDNTKITYENNKFQYEQARKLKENDNKTLGQLRKEYGSPNYFEINNELAPDGMSYGKYKEMLLLNTKVFENRFQMYRAENIGKKTPAQEQKQLNQSKKSAALILGGKIETDRITGAVLYSNQSDRRSLISDFAAADAVSVMPSLNNIKDNVGHESNALASITQDMVVWRTYLTLRQSISGNEDRKTQSMKALLNPNKPFGNINATFGQDSFGANFASEISGRPLLSNLLTTNMENLENLYLKVEGNLGAGINNIQQFHIDSITAQGDNYTIANQRFTVPKTIVSENIVPQGISLELTKILDNKLINNILTTGRRDSYTDKFSPELIDYVNSKATATNNSNLLAELDEHLIKQNNLNNTNITEIINTFIESGGGGGGGEDGEELTKLLPEEDQKRISNLAIIANEIVGDSLYFEANLRNNVELRSLGSNIKKIMEKGKEKGHTLEDENELKNAVNAFMGFINKNKLLKDTKEYTKITDSVLENIQARHKNYMKLIGR